MRYLILLSCLMMMSCQSPRDKALKRIQETEATMRKDTTMVVNKQLASDLITSYLSFAEQFPADSLAPEYMFKAAEVHTGTAKPREAIALYQKVLDKYPDFRKAEYCLFLQGFTYETQLGDSARAKGIYEEFLKKYPDNQLSNDVRFSLQNLGKSDEELIRQFEAGLQKNASN